MTAKEWMNMGFKAGYLRAKHCTVKQLIDLNMSLADIASGRYTVAEMIAGDSTIHINTIRLQSKRCGQCSQCITYLHG